MGVVLDPLMQIDGIPTTVHAQQFMARYLSTANTCLNGHLAALSYKVIRPKYNSSQKKGSSLLKKHCAHQIFYANFRIEII